MLVMCGLVLFAMDKAGHPAASRLRTGVLDVVTPVLGVVASPFDTVASIGEWVSQTFAIRSENITLRNQNIQLLQWQALAKQTEAENRSLRALLNVVPAQKRSYVTVQLVSDLSGPYAHSALVNGGTQQGIKVDQAVINENGLVGRVVDAGDTSARVLLLGDINSRVPVVAEQAREKSILAGNNEDLPSLYYVSANSKIAVGERIVTSGDGGVFPAGIPVGIVTSVEKGAVKVQPYVDASSIEYVSAVGLQ